MASLQMVWYLENVHDETFAQVDSGMFKKRLHTNFRVLA